MMRIVGVLGMSFLVAALAPRAAHATNFAVLLGGVSQGTCDEIEYFTSDDLVIPAKVSKDGRHYQPGQPVYGNITMRVRTGTGASKELYAWFQDQRSRRIKNKERPEAYVSVLASEKARERTFRFSRVAAVDIHDDKDALGAFTVLTLKPDSVELGSSGEPSVQARAEAGVSDKFAQVRGFSVELAGQTGKEVDTAWESVSGGELVIELTETTIGSDKFRTNSPGHKTVGEITLRGAMTDGRAAMASWINEAQAGRRSRRDMGVTLAGVDVAGKPIVGRQREYIDGYPTRYEFPKLSRASKEPPREGVVVMATRVEEELAHAKKSHAEFAQVDVDQELLAVAIADLDVDVARLVDKGGDARVISARIVALEQKESALRAWLEREPGKARDLVITIEGKPKAPARTYTLTDCFPTQWSSVNFDTSSTVQTETLTVKIGRIEFAN